MTLKFKPKTTLMTFLALLALASGCARTAHLSDFDLKKHLEKEEGVQMYAAETRRSMEQEVAMGNTDPLVKLAVYNYLGYGASPNQPVAMQLLRRAADKGDSRARFTLGVILAQGKEEGIALDKAQAYKLLSTVGRGVEGNADLARRFADELKAQLPADQVKAIDKSITADAINSSLIGLPDDKTVDIKKP